MLPPGLHILRPAYPGDRARETGFATLATSRSILGLGKTWRMPWNEDHQLQLRWVCSTSTNTQHLDGNADSSVAPDQAGVHSVSHGSAAGLVEFRCDSRHLARDADRGALLLLGLQMSSTQGGLRSALVFYLILRSTVFSRDNTLWVKLRPMGDSARNYSS